MEGLGRNLALVSQQVAILFALMAVGFACNKAKLFGEVAVKGIVELLVLIVTPCLIVRAFERDFSPAMLSGLGYSFLAALLIHVAGIVLSHLLRGRGEDETKTLRFAVIFSNAGFMGIPLEQALLGTEGVFYGAVYVAVFNLVSWSYGVVMMSGDRKTMRLKALLTNPGLMGIVVGLPLFFFSVHLPEVVDSPLKMMSDLNTPVAMVVIGFYLADADFKAAIRNVRAWGVAGLRLLAMPALALGAFLALAQVLAMPSKMMTALVVASSAPVAAFTTLFSVKFNRDVPLSVGLVSGTTVLSILTMPPIVALAMTLFK